MAEETQRPRDGGGAGRRLRQGRKGFAQAGGLLAGEFREAAGRRGIAEMRLLTGWEEIAGPDAAPICRPLRISYGAQGYGGTLMLLAAPGRGPELTAMAPLLLERVNAACGYRAVSRIRLTQTAPTGFADGASPFDMTGAPGMDAPPPLPPGTETRIAGLVDGVADPGLRDALHALGLAIAARTAGPNPKGQRR